MPSKATDYYTLYLYFYVKLLSWSRNSQIQFVVYSYIYFLNFANESLFNYLKYNMYLSLITKNQRRNGDLPVTLVSSWLVTTSPLSDVHPTGQAEQRSVSPYVVLYVVRDRGHVEVVRSLITLDSRDKHRSWWPGRMSHVCRVQISDYGNFTRLI